MRASRNPPSVFTIFRYAAYLNKVQRLLFDLAFLRVGQIFHSCAGNLRLYHHSTPGRIFFCAVANHL